MIKIRRTKEHDVSQESIKLELLVIFVYKMGTSVEFLLYMVEQLFQFFFLMFFLMHSYF